MVVGIKKKGNTGGRKLTRERLLYMTVSCLQEMFSQLHFKQEN